MHRSRLAGFIVDCKTDNLEQAAEFWSAALGYPLRARAEVRDILAAVNSARRGVNPNI